MNIVDLKIGQKKVRPPEFVDMALKEIGHNTGRVSPLVVMAMDLKNRPTVKQMLDDGVFQMIHNNDEATKEKWFKFSKTVQRILLATRKQHAAKERNAAMQQRTA